MTTTPHGQVPEALIDLIDAYAETRHRCGGIYNARTEVARKAVIEALSGVQALSAAPEAFLSRVIALCTNRGSSPENIEAWDKDDKWIADLWRQAEAMLAASPTPPAEQQAAPKAAPGDVLDEALRERDDAEDFIDALLDEVLGHERPEWSSSYGHADALNDVQERMTALHKPAVDKAWGRFQSAMAAPQQEAQEPTTVDKKTMELAESVGLIGPASRVGDLHAAIQRFHDLICVNATIKAAVMAAEAIGKQQAAPQQEAQEPVAWQSRTRPTWGGNTRPWSPWEPCTKEQAEDCWKTPLLHDWAYEARALFTAPQPAPAPLIARSLAEWHEDDGFVAWWAWNGREWAGEPAWIGNPNCEDWPGYHTHWTPHPDQPVFSAIAAQGEKDAG